MLQFKSKIIDVFDAYRQPDQPIANAKPFAISCGYGRVGHNCGMLNQTFDTTQRFCQSKEFAALQDTSSFFETTLHLNADDSTKSIHLTASQHMLVMTLQPGVNNALNLWMML